MLVNFVMEMKTKKLTVFRHIKDLRLSLGQISELLRLRKESYCNVKLKWLDTGLHTYVPRNPALLCIDVTGSRDLFPRYQSVIPSSGS